jgi:TRAP-type mannitol/chloroaromatic compound transport system permease large subunit
MLDPLHVALALGPLAVYLVVVGLFNLSRRPLLTTGARDLFALGIGMGGFAIIGPLDLFAPFMVMRIGLERVAGEAQATLWFGPLVWGLMLSLYLLCLLLVCLVMRPRLVVYNSTPGEVRVLLQRMIERLKLEHTWAGESLVLPTWGVQLHTTSFLVTRNVSICSTGARQSVQGWRRLRHELDRELSQVEVPPNPLGLTMLIFSALMLIGVVARLMQDPSAVARSMRDMLRL